jgi:hypothetical protein
VTQLPAYLLNDTIPDFTDRLGALTGTRAPPYLSIEGDRLTLVDSASEERPVLTRDDKTGDPYLDCCIIDVGDHASQVWYGRAWDPKSADRSPPACWSDNGVAPSINCSTPQALSCTPDPEGKHGCKWACWGSGRAREGSTNVPPACTKYIKLALLIPGEPIQFLLRVPPASHPNLSAYQQRFKGQPIKMRDVLTRISINDKTLSFKGVGFIDQPTAIARNEVLLAKKTNTLVGRGDVPRSGNPALPTPSSPASFTQTQIAAPTASSPASAPVEDERPLPAATQVGSVLAAAPQEALGTAVPGAATPARRRGRPPKADATPAAHGDPVAPFRQEATSQPNGAAPAGQFGMAQAPEPNPELAAALKSMFG